jgi:hypothetical protein
MPKSIAKKAAQIREKLLATCKKMINSYNPSLVTPSTHVDNFLKENKIRDENTGVFLREIMYGTQRFSKLLKIIVDGLYQRHPSKVNRLDRTMYIIMAYLTMYRIPELTFPEYRRLVKSQEPHKMHVFLHFLFDEVDFRLKLEPDCKEIVILTPHSCA